MKSSLNKENFEGLIDQATGYKAFACPFAACGYRVSRGFIRTVEENPTSWHITHPLRHDDLFLSFSDLGTRKSPKNKNIEAWVNRFGLLTGRNPEDLSPAIGYSHDLDHSLNTATQMSVDDFLREAKRARELRNLYRDIESSDATSVGGLKLWARITNPETRFDERIRSRVFPDEVDESAQARRLRKEREAHDFPKPSTSAEHDNLRGLTAGVLAEELSSCLTGMRLVTDVGDGGAMSNYLVPLMRRRLEGEDRANRYSILPHEPPEVLTSSWSCPDLLTAIFLQLHLFVTMYQPPRRCKRPGCTDFVYGKSSKEYCGDSCRSAARNYK